MKIVYLWRNGQAILVYKNQDGEYDYPEEKWTEQQPPTGIYMPCYYDGQQWIGQSKEEFEKTLIDDAQVTDDKELIIADLTSQVAKLSESENENKTIITELLTQVALIQGGQHNG